MPLTIVKHKFVRFSGLHTPADLQLGVVANVNCADFVFVSINGLCLLLNISRGFLKSRELVMNQCHLLTTDSMPNTF